MPTHVGLRRGDRKFGNRVQRNCLKLDWAAGNVTPSLACTRRRPTSSVFVKREGGMLVACIGGHARHACRHATKTTASHCCHWCSLCVRVGGEADAFVYYRAALNASGGEIHQPPRNSTSCTLGTVCRAVLWENHQVSANTCKTMGDWRVLVVHKIDAFGASAEGTSRHSAEALCPTQTAQAGR
jgi:hypothetical protein